MDRFFGAIGRFLRFIFLRRSEDIRRAADEQFAGSVEGIRAAFAIERDQIASDFRNLQDAVSGVLNVVEERKHRLEELDTEEKDLAARLEGALTAAEQARGKNDDMAFTQAKAAYERYKVRLTEIDAEQERLTTQVTDLDQSMKRHMLHLTEIKAKLEGLTQQEAEAVAEFVSSREIIDLNNRLMNAEDSLRESPVATVMERVQRMSSQARVTEKLVGTDARLQDQEYQRLGQAAQTGDDFDAVLAAREAARSQPAKAVEEPPTPTSERPQL